MTITYVCDQLVSFIVSFSLVSSFRLTWSQIQKPDLFAASSYNSVFQFELSYCYCLRNGTKSNIDNGAIIEALIII